MTELEKAKLEYTQALDELSHKIADMIETAQINAEKMAIQLESTELLLERIKNYKPMGFKNANG